MDETTEKVWASFSETQREKDGWAYHKFKAFGQIKQGIMKNDWALLDEGVFHLENALVRLNEINNSELAPTAEESKEREAQKKIIE